MQIPFPNPRYLRNENTKAKGKYLFIYLFDVLYLFECADAITAGYLAYSHPYRPSAPLDNVERQFVQQSRSHSAARQTRSMASCNSMSLLLRSSMILQIEHIKGEPDYHLNRLEQPRSD